MAITVETIAEVKICPDLSAFVQADGMDIASVIADASGRSVDNLVYEALLEHFWIIPKS